MAKYLLLKHYRGAPAPDNAVPMSEWSPDEVTAHIAYMQRLAGRLQESGELVDAQAVSPDGMFVKYAGPDAAPVVDGPFAETKDLIAGWMAIDVESQERAVEVAAELSAAPASGGRPLHEWIEVRPFLDAPPTITE